MIGKRERRMALVALFALGCGASAVDGERAGGGGSSRGSGGMLTGSNLDSASGSNQTGDVGSGGISQAGRPSTGGSATRSTQPTGACFLQSGYDYTPRGPEPAAILQLIPSLENGGRTWRDQSCATCHGEDAKGVPALGKDLTEALVTKCDLQLVDTIYYGATPEGNPLMVPFGGNMGSLADQDVADVFWYIKVTFGGGAASSQ